MNQIIKFFIPKNPQIWHVPRSQFQQSNADSQTAETHELILLRQMYARNRIEAQRLMKKYKATTAYEVITAINRKRPTKRERFQRGLLKLLRRIEGSSTEKPDLLPPNRQQHRLPY